MRWRFVLLEMKEVSKVKVKKCEVEDCLFLKSCSPRGGLLQITGVRGSAVTYY